MSEQCGNCRHAYQAGVREGKPAYVCRRFPPQTHFIIVPRQAPASTMLKTAGAQSMVPSEEQRSAFPAVSEDWACGEFSPALKVLS